MEGIIFVAIILVLIFVFAPDSLLVVTIFYGLAELFMILCALFFLVAVIMLLMSKKKEATYIDLDRLDNGFAMAVYEIDGKTEYNTFPTDYVIKKKAPLNVKTHVRVGHLFGKQWIFDNYSVLTIAIGFPTFVIGAIVMAFVVGFL